jgi:toxin ParE1/3/4
MARYRLTNLAVKDLADIWNYTFDEWSERQADFYYGQLVDSFERIAVNPGAGRSYEEVRKTLLGIHINKHIIFYEMAANQEVVIIRILHERMDIESRL